MTGRAQSKATSPLLRTVSAARINTLVGNTGFYVLGKQFYGHVFWHLNTEHVL